MDVSLSTGNLNIDNMVKSKPVKLGSKFDFKDSSLGAIVFVIMQYVFLALTFFVGLGLKYTLAVSVIALALLESLFAVTVFIVAKINRKDVFTCTTLNKKPNLVSSLLCVLIAVVCLYGFNGLTTFFLSFLEKIGYTGSSSSIVIPNFGMFLLYTITMAIIPAISEEMLFRGMIFNGLKDRGVKSAVIISAVFFMLMHGSPDQTVHQFVLGILLAYVFYYTGSLWYPIIIHFCNNFIVVLITYVNYGNDVSSMPAATWGDVISSLIIGVLFALIAGLIIYQIITKVLKKRKDKADAELALKSEAEMKINKNSAFDQQSETIVIADEQAEIHDANGKIITNENAEKKKMDTRSIVFFVISGLILCADWISVLIKGFMR